MNSQPDPARPLQVPWWYWVVLLPLMLLLFQILFGGWQRAPLDYSEFKRALYAGKVREVTITEQRLAGTLVPDGLNTVLGDERAGQLRCNAQRGCQFTTVRVTDPALVDELEAAEVRFVGKITNSWFSNLLAWLLPLGLLFWFWGRMLRRSGMASGGLFDIGKSRARVSLASNTGVSFSDVAGIDEAKEELMEVVGFLKNPDRYRRLGGKIPKGVLIVGAPGTGKTLLAKAVAGEAGVPFFSISGSEFVEMFVGVGAARVRDLFAQAEQKAPCIIFIDELDALGRARGVASTMSGYNEQEQTLNQLLVEMDGFNTNKGVIILAATNRPEILDPALLRPGRFDRHIALDRPDLKGRLQILQVHAKPVKFARDVSLEEIAARTAGFAGADLANLVNEAALRAGRHGKGEVMMQDVEEALDRLVAGLEKRTRVMNPREKQTVAYHESGHALIAELRPYADRVAKISIIPHGIAALGYTQQLPTEDRYLLKRDELLDRLDVMLGGRVAEELAFGEVSTGAQNDLQLATDLARRMVTQYGMSERLGLVSLEQEATPLLHPLPLQSGRRVSEATARVIDHEIAQLLQDARMRVRETLSNQRPLLDALARALLEKESLDRASLDALIALVGSTDSRSPPSPRIAAR